jgi:archaellum component FlaC
MRRAGRADLEERVEELEEAVEELMDRVEDLEREVARLRGAGKA